jgi:hypothetical protein
VNETKNIGVDSELTVGASQSVKVTNGYLDTVEGAVDQGRGNRAVEVNAVAGLHSGGASSTNGRQPVRDGQESHPGAPSR